jgi:CheY-like chemotaxis protein
VECPRDIRILLVDDEEGVRRGMRILLEELGCKVELAADTDEAVLAYRRSTIDLLIADFRLRNDDNGIRAIRTLRNICPELPALLLTGETAPNRLKEALETGIPVLHKPVSPQLLIQEISRISANQRMTCHGQSEVRTE